MFMRQTTSRNNTAITGLIVHEDTIKATRLSKLIKAIHRRRQVSWRILAQELGVSDVAVGKWRDGFSSPVRKHLDAIAAYSYVNWTPQQLDLYLDGKFDDQDIEDLLDNGIPEEILSITTIKQALKQYNYSERVEILAFLASLLKSGNDEADSKIQDSPKKNNLQKSIEIPRTNYLSRLADIRLRPLLQKSLTALGFDRDFRAAAESVTEDAEDAQLLTPILKHLVDHRFEPRIGYPPHFLKAIAALCCEVSSWVSDKEPVINSEKTYRDKVEQFLLDLEKPLNNHCQSAK